MEGGTKQPRSINWKEILKDTNNFSEVYAEYLSSKEWKYIRTMVLRRCRYRCEGCNEWEATVVHHLTYDNVGNELLFQLVGLCEHCHAEVHNKN